LTDGKFYFIQYMTGPSHVLLGLDFQDEPAAIVKIVARPPVGSCGHGRLDEKEIRTAVLTGVREGCEHAGRTLFPATIIYVESDSPRYSLYRRCAKLLVERVSTGRDLKQIAASNRD
jgi:hypothetical protein